MNWHCKTVRWAEADLRRIRHRVFIEEQGVDVAEEWDGHDPDAQHFLLLRGTAAAGCARVLHEPAHHWHIGRVAVLPEYRGCGAGLRLMHAALHWCRETDRDAPIYLHAQTSVTGFYEKLGFNSRGEIFMDAGIPHIAMWWSA